MGYSMVPKTFVLKMDIHCNCEGCQKAVKKLLKKIHGVDSVSVDADLWEVTVSGTVDPQNVLTTLGKDGKKGEILSQSPLIANQNLQMITQPKPVQAIDHQATIQVDKEEAMEEETYFGLPMSMDECSVVASMTFVLKMDITCNCEGCQKGVRKLLQKVYGVDSVSVDADLWEVTVSGTVDPQTVLMALGNGGKKAELVREHSIPLNNQKLQPKPVQVIQTPCPVMVMSNSGRHPSHPEHLLELKEYEKPYICSGCKEQGFGPRYRCEECDYELHKGCMFNTDTTSHEFFEGSIFKFFNQPPGKCQKNNCGSCIPYCNACGKAVHGSVYHSEKDGMNLHLHPCCCNLEKKIYSNDGAMFQLREKVLSKCVWCNKKTLEGSRSGISGWSYFSKCEELHVHVYCVKEMVLQAWKSNAKGSNCLALENLELSIQRKSNRNGGKVSKYWRIVKIFLCTIASIVLGDPTTLLVSLVTNSLLN